MKYPVLALTLLLSAAGAAPAVTWADRLFDHREHDYGAAPRGPTLVHHFRVTNTTGQPLHIASIRTSCGCAPASITRTDLAPGESAEVISKMDTRRCTGRSQKTIFVLFDQPQVEEVRLTVQVDCRADLFFTPEILDFGQLSPGRKAEASTTVFLAGAAGVRVTAASCESPQVQVTFQQLPNSLGETSYRVVAQLRTDLPPGRWCSVVWLTTDSPTLPRIHIPLSVEVISQPSRGTPAKAGEMSTK